MKLTAKNMWLKRTEMVLLLAGSLCVSYCLLVAIEAAATMHSSKNFSAGSASVKAAEAKSASTECDHSVPVTAEGLMGRLDIPELSLSVPILSNYENESLLKGIGHIPGTAMPGGLGTLGLAGHRDTFFRPLRNIKKNMTIRVSDTSGTYRYAVDSTEIVKPENVAVLDIGNRPALTLVTCYPFYYVGAAPLRFIVHAHLLSAAPDVSQ